MLIKLLANECAIEANAFQKTMVKKILPALLSIPQSNAIGNGKW